MNPAPLVKKFSVNRFGRFEVRLLQRQLFVDGKEAKVGARAFDVLLTLIERSERLRRWPKLWRKPIASGSCIAT